MANSELTLVSVRVGGNGQITAKVASSSEMEEQYDTMLIEMNNFMKDEQMVSVIPHHPCPGEIWCGKTKEGIWERVRIKDSQSRQKGLYCTCFLVDEGNEEVIPVTHLRHLPEKFRSIEHQVKHFCLHGIQPQTLLISPEDLHVYPGPRKKWDEAAVRHMDELIKGSHHIRCTVIETSTDGSLYVQMFIQKQSGGYICLNDNLISKEYATVLTDDAPVQPKHSPPARSIEEIIRARSKKRQQAKQMEAAARSDSEYSHPGQDSANTLRHSATQDYMSDGQSVSQDTQFLRSPTQYTGSAINAMTRSPTQHSDSDGGIKLKPMARSLTELVQGSDDNTGYDAMASDMLGLTGEGHSKGRRHDGAGDFDCHSDVGEYGRTREMKDRRNDRTDSDIGAGGDNPTQRSRERDRTSGYVSADEKVCSRMAARNKSTIDKLLQEAAAESEHIPVPDDSRSSISMQEGYNVGLSTRSAIDRELESPNSGAKYETTGVDSVGRKETPNCGPSVQARLSTPTSPSKSLSPTSYVRAQTSRGRGSESKSPVAQQRLYADSSTMYVRPPAVSVQPISPTISVTTGNNSHGVGRGQVTSQGHGILGKGHSPGDPDTVSAKMKCQGRGGILSPTTIGRGINITAMQTRQPVSPSSPSSVSNISLPVGRGGVFSNMTSSVSHSQDQIQRKLSMSTSPGQSSCSESSTPNLGRGAFFSGLVHSKSHKTESIPSMSRSPIGHSTMEDSDDSMPPMERFRNYSDEEVASDKKTLVTMPEQKSTLQVFNHVKSSLEAASAARGATQVLPFIDNGAKPKTYAINKSTSSAESDTGVSSYNIKHSDVRSEKHSRSTMQAASSGIISASQTGQAGFEKARIPRSASGAGANSARAQSASIKSSASYGRASYDSSVGSDREVSLNLKQSSLTSVHPSSQQVSYSSDTGIRRLPTNQLQSSPSSVVNPSSVRQPETTIKPYQPLSQQSSSMEANVVSGYAEQMPPQPTQSGLVAIKAQSMAANRLPLSDSSRVLSQDEQEPRVKSPRKSPTKPAPKQISTDRNFQIEAENKKSKILKMTAQRFMDALTQGKPKTVMQPEPNRGDGRKFLSTDCALVMGEQVKPCQHISKSHFSEAVVKSFEKAGFPAPSLVQSYSWPLIMRGRHIVAIAPSNTGKTHAYLYPLLSYFSQPQIYSEIRKNGMGAITIILTWTWQHAENVYLKVRDALEDRSHLKVLLVHGGGQEENKSCELINSCDILVITPPSLKRVLISRFTNLRRLCHLVIDDADQVLERFRPEMIHILKEYNLVITNEMKDYQCPRQILVFGSQWTDPINQFMVNRLNEPVLVITSQFEAAIYGKVKQVPHMCLHDQRLQKILGIVENLAGDSNNRTIIFASKKADIILIQSALSKYSQFSMMVHEDMDHYQALEVANQWPLPFLVLCDKHVSEMKIRDATCIIHYDMSRSKTEFGNRLGCMRQHYQDFTQTTPDKQSHVQTTSHLLITDQCVVQAKTINELLIRSNYVRPKELKDFIEGILEAKEEADDRELCTQLLAFGACRDKWRCKYRHAVLPDIDMCPTADWLPSEGDVKVLVTHIIDASHYYVRVLGVRPDGQVLKDMSSVYTELEMDIGIWYSNRLHQKRHTALFTGIMCGYQNEEMFYRVKILNLMEMNRQDRTTSAIEAHVMFVDSGREETVPATKLYELPEHLKNVPFQAVEVFVCKVRPVDKDTTWTCKASIFIYESLHKKELEGKIVLRLGYTLWLDPLVLRVHLGESKAIINKFYAHTELVRNGLADENPNHLDRLYKLCEGKVNIPKVLLIKTGMSQQLETDVLPACRQFHKVHVASVKNPDLFFVQRSEKDTDLVDLMATIDDYVENQAEDDVLQDIQVGKYCLAQYSSFDQKWYRGQIQKIEEDNVQIFFADYGDSDLVPRDKLREFPVDKFFELPLQAIECKLAHIEKPEETWTEKTGDAMWDLSHYVNSGDFRCMTAKVAVDKEPAQYAGRHKFVLELSAKYGACNLDLAQELVWRQLANSQDDTCTALLDKPMLSKRMYPSLLHKLPDLASSCYWDQDPSNAVRMAEEILKILNKHLPSMSESMEEVLSTTVKCLVKLVGRLSRFNVHNIILDCLLCCIKTGEKLSEVMIQENLVSSVVRCLEMNSDTVVQQQAADFIAKASNLSARLQGCFQQNYTVEVLYELLEYTTCEHVQGSVCRAFAAICSGSESIYDYLMSHGICQKLASYLSKSTDHLVSEGVLTLIVALTQHDSGHDDLKRESLIEAIVKTLRKTDCDKCIQYCVQQCDHFASTRRKHKTFLLEKEMVIILNRILQLELPSSTLQLCRDLKTSLDFKVPQEPMAGVRIRPENYNPVSCTNSVVQPRIDWSQNSFVVRLSIKVDDIRNRNSKDLLTFTDDSVQFRAMVNGVNYGFHYKLTKSIIPEKCTWSVKPREVLVSIKKAKEGRWSRLLQSKTKPSNLFNDYEQMLDSSDLENSGEDMPFVLKKKKTQGFKKGKVPPPRSQKLTADQDDADTDTSDSLENREDYEDNNDDYYRL